MDYMLFMDYIWIYSQLVKGDEIVQPCDQHNHETVTLRKHVTKYKNMLKWTVEFL